MYLRARGTFIQKMTVDKTCKKCCPFNEPERSSCKSNHGNLLQARWIQYARSCIIALKYSLTLCRNTVRVSAVRRCSSSYYFTSLKFRINGGFAHPVFYLLLITSNDAFQTAYFM